PAVPLAELLDGLARRDHLLAECVVDLRPNLNVDRGLIADVFSEADVFAGHTCGRVQALGLGHAHALDVELPAVLPALGVDCVCPAHCSHPSLRHANFLMMSPTTPGETAITWAIWGGRPPRMASVINILRKSCGV